MPDKEEDELEIKNVKFLGHGEQNKFERRLTFEDSARSQSRFMLFLDWLIEHNSIVKEDKRQFIQLLTESLLDAGSFYFCYYNHKTKKIPLGSVNHLAYRLCFLNENTVELTWEDVKVVEPISVFWKILQEKLFEVLPHGLINAFAHSKEYPLSPRMTSFDFQTQDENDSDFSTK